MRVPTHFESSLQISNLQGEFTKNYKNQRRNKGNTKILKHKHKDQYIHIYTNYSSIFTDSLR